MQQSSTLGLIGLGVMGQSLVRNFASRDIAISVYNAPLKGEEHILDQFLTTYPSDHIHGHAELVDFIQSLERPRTVFLMIKAGKPVDIVIEQLIPLLEEGDIIIDGGNSFYHDTQRRYDYLKTKDLNFVGMGVSGGEKGALEGPSMMPGGNTDLVEILLPLFRKVTAKTEKGEDCIHWMGKGGAGHFVKMVHNGIEYADMAMLSEAYFFIKKVLGMSNDAIGQQFKIWQDGELDGYLLQITTDICQHQEGNEYLIDQILDVAGNKGTGKWTVGSALELGVPAPSLSAALFSRYISAFKDLRVAAAEQYGTNTSAYTSDTTAVLADLEQALIAAKIISYAQGFHLLSAASEAYDWELSLASICKTWRAGCIIRSKMLLHFIDAFEANAAHLLLDENMIQMVQKGLSGLKNSRQIAQQHHLGVPTISASLEYFLSFSAAEMPTNMIQAQRDFFGAHTYERKDHPRGQFFHTVWED